MDVEQSLDSMQVLLAQADDVDALVARVAESIASAEGVSLERVEAAFREAIRREGFSIGTGVALPHSELEGLTTTHVCLATTTNPVALPTIDGRQPDLFFFTLAPPNDPEGHLLLLARLARLCQSRTLLDGLRRAKSSDEATQLIRAARLRHAPAGLPAPVVAAAAHALVLIVTVGEKVVDALLVDLLDLGVEQATILEGQSLAEAMTREVPLFAGFRDIFGDPGGQRVIFVEVAAARVNEIVDTVRRVCENESAKEARVCVLPLEVRWTLTGSGR